MEISNNKIIVALVVLAVIIFYIHNSKKDITRYKAIIDNYMSENLNEKENTSVKKTQSKKVRFKLPSENN